MNRVLVLVLVLSMALLGAQTSHTAAPKETTVPVTFNKDVLPILQENCQTCHRPGEIGPMALTSYEGTRPWAKAIKAAVMNRQMPPWLADSHYGEFRNDPKLQESDIRTLAAWADSGAPEGDPEDKPEPLEWLEGWRIRPDVVVSMPQPFDIPAQGAGEVRGFLIPNPFTEDTWVTSIEVRPGNRSVVHHAIVQVVNRDSDILARAGGAFATPGRPDSESGYSSQGDLFSRNDSSRNDELKLSTGEGAFMTMEAVYAPGASPIDYRYAGSAKLIPGGGQLRIEMHYTPNGTATTDRTRIGFTLAKSSVRRSFVLMAPEHLTDTSKPIPAGDANWETSGQITFTRDAELVWFMPHMHLRGKDMTFRLAYPDGRVETVLSVKYNFNWQLGYEVEKPIKIPRGTRMQVTAHYDNSANNKFNPEPAQNVAWGDLTSQEMMIPWFGVVVNGNLKPESIAFYEPHVQVAADALARK